jgi:surface antigen
MRSFVAPTLVAVLPLALGLLAGCGAGDAGPSTGEPTSSTSEAVTAGSIASLALANVGGSACGTNSLGSHSFDSSCTGNGGQPEYWCADFARWVWAEEGAGNTSELTAAAGSFYVYGQNHGTLENSPAVGDAVVFDYQGGGVADHVALVTQVNSDGTIETVSGDWNGQSGTEAQFSSTSHVVLNSPAYLGTVGSSPGVMGMTISGFIAPVGIAVADWGAGFVSQSFPLATTTLTMFAGQTLSET